MDPVQRNPNFYRVSHVRNRIFLCFLISHSLGKIVLYLAFHMVSYLLGNIWSGFFAADL